MWELVMLPVISKMVTRKKRDPLRPVVAPGAMSIDEVLILECSVGEVGTKEEELKGAPY